MGETGAIALPPPTPSPDGAATTDELVAPEPAAPADPAPARRFSLGNRPPLTGIRGIGVTVLLIDHSYFGAFPGSWFTISIFCVLSGFLITSMLVGEGERTGGVSLRTFYERRAVRLLPPLFLTVALLAAYAGLVYVADAAQRVWGDIAAATFYYADYRSASGHEPFLGFLAQAWSLSVEEQYYVLWSVLMVVALKFRKRKLAYGIAAAGVVASAADRLWTVTSAPAFTNAVFNRAYYAFDTRADALFLGCLLGLAATGGHLGGWPPWAKGTLAALAAASAATLVWIRFEVPLGTRAVVTWGLPLSELAAAIIIAYFIVNPVGLGSRFMGLGPFVFVGYLSYTIYLVHWPIFIAIAPYGTHWGFWPTEALRLALVFGIAVASWYLMERPLTRWRRRSLSR